MSITTTLKIGSIGSQVKELQERLIKAGFGNLVEKADAIFGPQTAEAVRAFQKSKGLTADAIVGPKTTQALIGLAQPSQNDLTNIQSQIDIAKIKVGALASGIERAAIQRGRIDIVQQAKQAREQIITPPTAEPKTGPVSTFDLRLGTIPAPEMPEEIGKTTMDQFIQGAASVLDSARKNLENTYNQQIKNLKAGQKQSQKRIDELTVKQEGIITGEVQEILKPFRENLEKTERERLKIEENYLANQKSTQELETLLTQAQQEIKVAEEITGLSAIRTPRIVKIKEDAIARIGIVEAVMAARNNQITVAENLIDRSTSAIEADKKDQLNYYQTLLNFYEGTKDEEGKRLIILKANEKEFLDKQIGLLESDLSRIQENTDYLKGLMLDPDTADLIEQSGVTLIDSVETINQKMSKQIYRLELVDLDNEMIIAGYKPITTDIMLQGKTQDQLITINDSRGNPRIYLKPEVEPENVPSVDNFDRLIDLAKLGNKDALIQLGITTDGLKFVTVSQEEKAKLNNQIASSETYKAITSSENAWRALKEYENFVNKEGAVGILSPVKHSEAQNIYTTALLQLKEFYNLGVLNGPDLEIMAGLLPSAALGGIELQGETLGRGISKDIDPFRGAQVKSAIKIQKSQFEDKLDNDYLTIKSQYRDYSSEDLTVLKDIDRRYLQMKSQVNPAAKKFLQENADMPLEDAVQVINQRL